MNEPSGMTHRVARLLGDVLHIDPPAPGTDLIGTGLLDSIGFMHLFVALEREFGIGVATADLSPDRFRTVESIAAFVAAKQGGEQGPVVPAAAP
ncbi:acyl carrier protein [Streptomyces decoyicus]|uniref:acyl carrier protein n=1 Tax=Streptomyces decoyicus TaxID=249567 RepID=UPI003869730A|nr:acyl carrier protein [Streptomyces decoyicus]